MKRLGLLFALVLVSSCFVTPTPTVTPPTATPTPQQSPPVTPTPPTSVLATPVAQAVSPLTFCNSGFERPYISYGAADTTAKCWHSYHSDVPPCMPGRAGCTLPCPSNCGTCTKSDLGCWWASPEWAESWYADYGGQRVHAGQSAQKMFVYAREGDPRLYQQVAVMPGTVMTFTTWLMGWQCFDNSHCNLAFLNTQTLPNRQLNPIYNPTRVAYLLGQWGCDYKTCKGRAISDLPYALNIRVGIDTKGTISPTAQSVVWGTKGESFDVWSPFTVTAKAQSSTVTLWIESMPMFDYARASNDIYVDSASLETYFPYKYVYLPIVR